MPVPAIIAGAAAVAGRLAAKKVAKEAAKKAIPTKIKTATKTYTVKKTPTGKVKVTNPSTGLSVKFPRTQIYQPEILKQRVLKRLLQNQLQKKKQKKKRRLPLALWAAAQPEQQ
jgi:hypothetical protein